MGASKLVVSLRFPTLKVEQEAAVTWRAPSALMWYSRFPHLMCVLYIEIVCQIECPQRKLVALSAKCPALGLHTTRHSVILLCVFQPWFW